MTELEALSVLYIRDTLADAVAEANVEALSDAVAEGANDSLTAIVVPEGNAALADSIALADPDAYTVMKIGSYTVTMDTLHAE